MDDDYVSGKRTDYREAIRTGNGDGNADGDGEDVSTKPESETVEPEAGSTGTEEDTGGDGPEPAIEAGEERSSEEGVLTIALPDGSESVAEAMLVHRRMLSNPAENGLAPANEVEELREAVEALSGAVPEDLEEDLATLEASVDEVADELDRQQRQIQELGETVARLAEILGTSVEFRSIETGT